MPPAVPKLPEAARRTGRTSWLVVVGVGVVAAAHIWKLPSALYVIDAELGLGLVFSGVLLGMIHLASMVGGLVVAWSGERFGLRRLLMLGLVLLSVGSLCGAISPDATLLVVSRLIEGVGFLLCTVLAPALIRLACEPRSLNTAMGAWGAFQGLATLIGFSLSALLLQWSGWRFLWAIMALLTLAMLLPLAQRVPSDRRMQAIPTSGSLNRILATVRTGPPWLAGLVFACYTVQWMAVMSFLPSVYSTYGMTQLTAGLLSAAVGGINIVGALVAGRLLHHGRGPIFLLVLCFIVMSVTSIGLFAVPWTIVEPGIAGALSCALLFSMIGGMAPAILSRVAVDLAPPNGSVSAVIGLMQQLFNVGNFIGPFILAWIAMRAGGWHASWVMTCGFSLLGILLALLLRPRVSALPGQVNLRETNISRPI